MFGDNKKPQTYQSVSSQPVDTLISRHCTIEGNLLTQNSVKVDGRIQGNLQATGQAIIGEHGLVKGDVHSTDLLVFGRLEGNVRAKAVHLEPAASIQGAIETETLQMEPGVSYTGSLSTQSAHTTTHLSSDRKGHSSE